MLETREWIFNVLCHVDPGERVFLTGSCNKLGNWNPEHLIPLVPEVSSEVIPRDGVWRTQIHIPTEKVEYRFCVCVGMQHSNGVTYCVKRWETHLHPRMIPPNVSNVEDPEILRFGHVGDLYKVNQGWLINESALFLRLCRSDIHNDPIILWKKKHKDKKCFTKVIPVDISKTSGTMDSCLDFPTDESTEAELSELRQHSRALLPVVEVSVLKEGMTEFRYQDQFGVSTTGEDYVAFRCAVHNKCSIGFLIDVYIEDVEGDTPKYIGCSFVLPSTFNDTYGVATIPITSPKHIPIGQLTLGYMVVHPLEQFQCDMKLSYTRYWKETWKGLDVGHRGAGDSYHSQTKNCANIRENTIASLTHAWENGADMVEFDVQLSKDLVPIIYHDFHASIALRQKKEPHKAAFLDVPIKDLTIAQLHQLKLYHKTEKGLSRFSDEETEDHQPFPTLAKALEVVPHSCAFNIELKWTMRLHDGTYELQHPIELNRFLDCILKVVLQSSSPRKIIFSCFHPDICTMLRLKQNLYPVLFLTQGQSTRWPPYDDIRTRSIERAVLYASSANILGINVYTEDLLRDVRQIDMAFAHDLIVFCWGDENSDRETIRSLKEMGLHAIIYDKIDVYNTKLSKRSDVFLCDDKETCRCFPSSCKDVKEGSRSPPAEKREGETSASPTTNEIPLVAQEPPMGSPPKRPKTSDTHTSFCGVLSQIVI